MEVLMIPVKDLTFSGENARTTKKILGKSDHQLLNSIDQRGIRTPLLVVPDDDKYGVIDGGRRLSCLQELVKQGVMPDDNEIPCLLDPEANKLDSMITNIVRQPMTVGTECLAMKDLVIAGHDEDYIAAAFNTTVKTVRQRLSIGNLPKYVLTYIDDGDITIAVAKLLTSLSKDQVAEWHRAFKDKESWTNQEYNVKRHFFEGSVSAADIKFPIEDYDGPITQDLFSENEDVMLMDRTKVKVLQMKAVEGIVAELKEQGWKDVVLDDQSEDSFYKNFKYHSVYDEDERRGETFTDAHDALLEKHGFYTTEVRDEIEKLREKHPAAPLTEEEIAETYAVVSVRPTLKVEIHTGLMPDQSSLDTNAAQSDTPAPPKDPLKLSKAAARLVNEQKSIMAASHLLHNNNDGLRWILYSWMSNQTIRFHIVSPAIAGLKVMEELDPSYHKVETIAGDDAFMKTDPEYRAELWEKLTGMDRNNLIPLLIDCFIQSVGFEFAPNMERMEGDPAINALAAKVPFQMTDELGDKLSKPQAKAWATECGYETPDNLDAMKTKELRKVVTDFIKKSDERPEIFRDIREEVSGDAD